MRTTITLDLDVVAAVQRLRRQRGIGLSEAVNALIRSGLKARKPPARFEQRTRDLGLRVDVRNVGEALELIEGPSAR
jgi:Arc/MetJ family transcription regulator